MTTQECKAMEQTLEAHVPENTLPVLRDKHGHMSKYPGRIVYTHDAWRLVYMGTIDGKHEFFAEQATRVRLGALSFAKAKAAMIDLIQYNKEHPL